MKNKAYIPMTLHASKILIYYEDIVKMPGLFILRYIRDSLSDKFKNFINVNFLKETPDKDLTPIFVSRIVKNPLEWLKIKDFDYNKNYDYLKNKYINMYLMLDYVSGFDKIIDSFLNSYMIDKVLIFSNEYDKRIDFDIQTMFNNHRYCNKLEYISGDFETAIDTYEPEAVFYPYLDQIYDLSQKNKDIIFSIPTYGFNFENSELLKKIDDDNKNNIGFYPILRNNKDVFLG